MLPEDPIRQAIRRALAEDSWEGHAEPLTSEDLDRLAEVSAAAVRQLDEACTCGWGGQHDPDNQRCDLNRETPAAART